MGRRWHIRMTTCECMHGIQQYGIPQRLIWSPRSCACMHVRARQTLIVKDEICVRIDPFANSNFYSLGLEESTFGPLIKIKKKPHKYLASLPRNYTGMTLLKIYADFFLISPRGGRTKRRSCSQTLSRVVRRNGNRNTRSSGRGRRSASGGVLPPVGGVSPTHGHHPPRTTCHGP